MKTKALLTNLQLDKLSDLSLGLGQLFFGSTVAPYVIPSVDKPTLFILLFGLGFAIGFWIFAIWIVKGALLRKRSNYYVFLKIITFGWS